MTDGLRQRSPNMTTFESNTSDSRHGGRSTSAGGLSLESMKAASPQYMGSVLKLHVPIIYSFLPRFIQQLLNRAAARFTFFLSFVPTWKRRYLVLLGGYLYKFDTDNDKSHPKGSPIPLDGLDSLLISSINEYDFGGVTINEIGLPMNHSRSEDGSGGIFYVSNIRKTTYYACTNNIDGQTWVNSIREGRQETIKRRMGHVSNDSYPKIWDHYDTLGKSLTQSKHRIRTRIEQQKTNDMELVSVSGGPIPRGYYG